jgi:hypothetical protein
MDAMPRAAISVTAMPSRTAISVKHQPRLTCQASPETGHAAELPLSEAILYVIKGGGLRPPPASAAGGRKRPSSRPPPVPGPPDPYYPPGPRGRPYASSGRRARSSDVKYIAGGPSSASAVASAAMTDANCARTAKPRGGRTTAPRRRGTPWRSTKDRRRAGGRDLPQRRCACRADGVASLCSPPRPTRRRARMSPPEEPKPRWRDRLRETRQARKRKRVERARSQYAARHAIGNTPPDGGGTKGSPQGG